MSILVYVPPDLFNQNGDLPAFRGPLSSLNGVPWELALAVNSPAAPLHIHHHLWGT